MKHYVLLEVNKGSREQPNWDWITYSLEQNKEQAEKMGVELLYLHKVDNPYVRAFSTKPLAGEWSNGIRNIQGQG